MISFRQSKEQLSSYCVGYKALNQMCFTNSSFNLCLIFFSVLRAVAKGI